MGSLNAWETLQPSNDTQHILIYYHNTCEHGGELRFLRPNFIARKFCRLWQMWCVTSLHPSPEEATKWPLKQLWMNGGLSFPATAIYLRAAVIPNLSDQWTGHCSGGRGCRRGADRKNKNREGEWAEWKENKSESGEICLIYSSFRIMVPPWLN